MARVNLKPEPPATNADAAEYEAAYQAIVAFKKKVTPPKVDCQKTGPKPGKLTRKEQQMIKKFGKSKLHSFTNFNL